MIAQYVQLLRPRQWIKNLIIYAGLIYSENLFDLGRFLESTAAFCAFCVLSSAVYIVNDIADAERDRVHPIKSKRPIPSGHIAPSSAAAVAVGLFIVSLSGAFLLRSAFGWIALAYAVIMLVYTFRLKRVVILDIIIISLGFVLRAVAGAAVVGVSISSWLLVCTMFLALFLGFSKRRHELMLLGDQADTHRSILVEYSPYLLDQMVAVVTASSVIAYTLYTTSTETIEKFGTRNLVFTTPFVLYGIFRYLYLIHQKNEGGSPESIFLKDRPILINIILYMVVTGLIVYL